MLLTFNIINKPGVGKDGQIALVSDVDCVCSRAYEHRHNIHTRPNNFKSQGSNKLCIIIDKLEEMVVGCQTTMVICLSVGLSTKVPKLTHYWVV